MGVTTRLLRFAVELKISCRGRAVGLPYAYELAGTLRTSVRVFPAPHHGGVFIGRACHAIAEGGDAVCRTLLVLVTDGGGVSGTAMVAAGKASPAHAACVCPAPRVRR